MIFDTAQHRFDLMPVTTGLPLKAKQGSSSNHPVSLDLKSETGAKRYHYWMGASGRRYICTIFSPRNCPTVSSAVYIAVHRNEDGTITPLSAGFYHSPFVGGVKNAHHFAEAVKLGANEIHMHLLADDPFEAEEISNDIYAQIFPAETAAKKCAA